MHRCEEIILNLNVAIRSASDLENLIRLDSVCVGEGRGIESAVTFENTC